MSASSPVVSLPSYPSSAPALRAWHRAIRVEFFVLGVALGVWGAQVPAAKAHYGLDEQSLSIALLGVAAGAVLCLLSAGALVARFGARRCARGASVLLCLSLAAVLQSQAYGVLLALMLLFGASGALLDVSINAEGNALEARAPRKLMSGLHAMFSLGGMAGALLCAALHRAGVADPALMAGSGLALLPVAWFAARPLSAHRTDTDEAPASIAWPRGPLAGIGAVIALGMVAEGAMYDWSALFLQQERHADAATGALAFAVFSAAMAFGRLCGDRVREAIAPVALLRASGALASAGMALAILVASPWAGLAGFALVGLGLANVVPVLFVAAGQLPDVRAASGVAAASAIGYLGFMVGPPLIGALARWTSLSAALWVVAMFAALMAVAARAVLGPRR